MEHELICMKSLEKEYGDFFLESQLVEFDLKDVPEKLQFLAPYARFWGIADDWERCKLAAKASASIRKGLVALIVANDDELDVWLAGKEATLKNPSNAYVAYSAMRMCADTF